MSENKREYDRKRYYIRIIEDNNYPIDYLNKSSLELKELIKNIRKKKKTEKDYFEQQQKILDEEDRRESGDDYIPISQREYTEDLDNFYTSLEDDKIEKLREELSDHQRVIVSRGQSSLLYGKGGSLVEDHTIFKKSLEDSLTWLDELKKKKKEQERLKNWIF